MLKLIRIHKKIVYFRAAISVIGLLKHCPHDVLEGFARLAVSVNGFGDPSKWSKMDVRFVIECYFEQKLFNLFFR